MGHFDTIIYYTGYNCAFEKKRKKEKKEYLQEQS